MTKENDCNDAPPYVEGQGNFTITDQGELILKNIWLGAREQENVTEACGHIFRLQTKKQVTAKLSLHLTPGNV